MVDQQVASSCETEAKDRTYRELSDASLLIAAKNEESGAIVELIQRFQGLLLLYATRLGVDDEERHSWVLELLHDVILSLVRPSAAVPESLAAYLVRAARNKAYSARRSEIRQKRTLPEHVGFEFGSAESSDDTPELSRPLRRLAEAIEKMLTPDEKQLLDWAGEAVPLRTVAEWTGVTRTTAAHRLSRLRQRLKKMIPEIVRTFPAEEQHEVQRLLDRLEPKGPFSRAATPFRCESSDSSEELKTNCR